MAASAAERRRGGSGRRALPPTMPGRSAAKLTSSSGLRAIARRQPVTARLNGSVGLSFPPGLLGLILDDMMQRSICWSSRGADDERAHAHSASRNDEVSQLSATFTDDS